MTQKLTSEPQVSNEELSKIWEEALLSDNIVVLRLIRTIDSVKNALSKERSRVVRRREKYKSAVDFLAHKRHRQGQTYMRNLIAESLSKAGFKEASDLASKVYVDYKI